MLAIFSSSFAHAKTDKELARKQLIQATKILAKKTGMNSRQTSKAIRKIRTMSSRALQKSIDEMQGKNIALGENTGKVANKLADAFKSYGDKSGLSGKGHLSKTFGGNTKSGNGMNNSLQDSMRTGVRGPKTSQQSNGAYNLFRKGCETCADIWDWATKSPDEAYKDRNEGNGGIVYGKNNGPKGCVGTGCAQKMPTPEHGDSNTGNDPLSRKKNIARINANNGKFGFKRGNNGSSTTIDPKTGKTVANQKVITKTDKYGNPIRSKQTTSLTAQQRKEIELKTTGGKVK